MLPYVTFVMPGRLDPLFPECCYECAYHDRTTGTCEHDLSQLLRLEFVHDPNRPCPITAEIE